MTGLDKILRQIKSESDAAVASSLAKAKTRAEEIAVEAQKAGQAECEAIAQKSANEVADALARAQSAASLQKRKAVLAEKQLLINETIVKAKQSLLALPDGEYFAVILRMAKKFALAQAGEVAFAQKDLARLPQGFETALNEALLSKGAKLTISKQPCKIDGGFVLTYGGVEENCSFTALFDSAHESLQDKVQGLLFS